MTLQRKVAFGLLVLCSGTWLRAAGQALQPSQAPTGLVKSIIKSQHLRLPFAREIQRIAVGDTDILGAELLNNREVLVLGHDRGRTTLIVWFTDGTLREYLFAVQRDLSVLQAALKRVHTSIEVESAPDRDALVLTGLVPTFTISQTAEAVARNYLDASDVRRGSAARPFIAGPSVPGSIPPDDGHPDRTQQEIEEWAREHDLPYFDEQVHFPDVRIEYEDVDGRHEHEDVEVVTIHYRGSHGAAAARSGFACYGGSSARISGAGGGGGRGGGRQRGFAEELWD